MTVVGYLAQNISRPILNEEIDPYQTAFILRAVHLLLPDRVWSEFHHPQSPDGRGKQNRKKIAISLIIFTITGIIMWFKLLKNHRIAWIIFIGGLIYFGITMALLAYW